MEQNNPLSEKPKLGKAWDFADKFFRFIGWNFITGAMLLATKNVRSDSSIIAFALISLFMVIIIVSASLNVFEYSQSYTPRTDNIIIKLLFAIILTATVQLGTVLVMATAISAVMQKHC